MLSKPLVIMMVILITATSASLVGITSIIYKPVNVQAQTSTTGALQDRDNDGVPNATDNCSNGSNPEQKDTDRDGISDACDNAPNTPNPNQSDLDLDSIGDVADNCHNVANPNQANSDGDKFGDACDRCPSQPGPNNGCPQQQPQQQSQQQTPPATTRHPLQVIKQPQSPLSSIQGQKVIQSAPIQEQSKAIREINMQALADNQLLDRLFPQILKRLDGKTLAAKVVPYLDISANVITRDGPTATIKKSTPIIGSVGSSPLFSTAKCNNGETPVGGGFRFDSEPEDSFVTTNIPNIQENGWFLASQMKVSGKLQASVTCLTINVGLKNVQQQSSQPPPGGPPLQPPPRLR